MVWTWAGNGPYDSAMLLRHKVFGLLIGLVAGAFAGSVLPGPAQADEGGLTVQVSNADPARPVVTLTNGGSQACQVATTALGTVSVLSLSQNGQPVIPVVYSPGFDEPLESVLAQHLQVLQPGSKVDIVLQTRPFKGGRALDVVAPGGLAPTGLLYPLSGQAIDLHVAYTLPIAAESGPAACVANGASAAIAGQQSAKPWLWWLAGAIVLLAIIGLVSWLVLRRRPGAAAAVIAVLLLMIALGRPVPADAHVTISDPSLQGPYNDCLAILQQPGHDPAGILPTILGRGFEVLLVVPSDGVTHEGGGPGLAAIYWNINDRHAYVGGGNADPCTSLYHEMFHAFEDSQGIQDMHECITAGEYHTGIGINEVRATQAQNRLRQALGMPQRTTYGSRPLPTTPCRASRSTDPRCRADRCSLSDGDPHITTWDGRRYDLQAVGEFVAAQDPAGDFAIQVRQQPWGTSRTVAVNTAIAVNVAGAHVQLELSGNTIKSTVDGAEQTGAIVDLANGGQLRQSQGDSGPYAMVSWPDGSVASAVAIAGMGLNLSVDAAPARQPKLHGLLVTQVSNPDTVRVNDQNTLFRYPSGRNTASYTDRAFPYPATTQPDTAAAKAICAAAGVTAPSQLQSCVFDVSQTGQPAFAASARAGQTFLTGAVPGEGVFVPATSNIYLAADLAAALPHGGTLPVRMHIAPGTRQVSFTAEGELGPDGADPDGGPDGANNRFPDTDITGTGGISGIRHTSASMFLVGVFLPDGPANASDQQADVSNHDSTAVITPQLGILFAIGDGLTTTGVVQKFTVPAGATRLYLGFADAYAFHGTPGYYDDNTGSLTVTMTS